MWSSKDVYYVSGSTAILAEDMGRALLAQFQETQFREEKMPFIRSPEEARVALERILDQSAGTYPLVFCTLLDRETLEVFNVAEVELFDIFLENINRLEQVLEAKALKVPGCSRQFSISKMTKRVDAIHYSLDHDDGVRIDEYDEAEIILVGVSRTGKTPVSIYLATHMEVKAANFPLTPDHLDDHQLPPIISKNRRRVVGLTCSPKYLHRIRDRRYPNSTYASMANCALELQKARSLYTRDNIKTINVEGKSIEEISVQVMQTIGVERKKRRKRLELWH